MISLLIPTYNRPGRLLRLLRGLNIYYSLLFASGSSSLQFPPVREILIADGSDDFSPHSVYLRSLVQREIAMLSSFVTVNYMDLAGRSLNDRLFDLAYNASSDYVLPLGDDDFPVLENLDSVLKEIKSTDELSIALGRLINIRGIKDKSLSLSVIERPYSGFSIDLDCILSRIASHRVLNSLGIPALFYGLQSKTSYLSFTRLMYDNQEDLYYGGQEFLHQIHCCISGKISFLSVPMIYRDFTYWGYKRESQREAPDSDAYPYYGEKSINIAADMLINSSIFCSKSDSLDYINSLLRFSEALSRSREFLFHPDIDSAVTNRISNSFPARSLHAVTKAWLMTLQYCYNLND